MKLIMILIMFLVLGALFIISNENLSLGDEEEFDKFSERYYDWLSSLFDNGKQITGYVVNSEWLPDKSDE